VLVLLSFFDLLQLLRQIANVVLVDQTQVVVAAQPALGKGVDGVAPQIREKVAHHILRMPIDDGWRIGVVGLLEDVKDERFTNRQ